MVCPGCGVEVSDEQRFCNRCGTALAAKEGNVWAAPTPDTGASPLDQPPTEQIETQSIDIVTDDRVDAGQAGTQPTETADRSDAPTEPVDAVTGPVGTISEADAVTEPVDAITEPDGVAERAVVADDGWASATPTDEIRTAEAPTTTSPTTTAEMPAVFDGVDDLVEYPPPREPFRFRLVFLFSLFSLAAALMAFVADVIDIRTSRPTAGIDTGASTLDDLGSNLAMAGFIGAAAMVLGGLLACFGIRWGAGLAGGAALAVVGWASLTIGLAEFPIAVAESITRTSPEAFTLTVTRDVGWLLVAGIGVLAVLVFMASLRLSGTGGHRPLNPWIAAVTAVAGVVLAFGPLVPVGDAVFADNFRSTDPNRDLPTAFFAGRLAQVALIAVAVVVGSLVVRAFGLGLATGGVTVATWMWATSLAGLGSNPVGIADRNPGADDTVPHAVTSVGVVITLVMLAVASVTALWQRRRHRVTA